MSLQIIKSGLLDTIQDSGRYGYQHLGINPGGAMDRYAAQYANALLGKDPGSPLIEVHFPAAHILFEEKTVICITGADFTPMINKKTIPAGQPVMVNKNTVLHFEKKINGSRSYIAILSDLLLEKWLQSYSTNLVAGAGGFQGRPLKKGDVIPFTYQKKFSNAFEKDFFILPWRATENISLKKEIRFLRGNEWHLMTEEAITIFTAEKFSISGNSNRMGYRLNGPALAVTDNIPLVSSGVTFGTIQLLPEGQLIVLMADHQTTGGYPRVAHAISADIPLLAQCNPGDEITFTETTHSIAELALLKQQRDLHQVQTASSFQLEKFYAL